MRVQTFDRQHLSQLETYLGHIEIVRDGVLEVVLFPAPQSARLAVDDIHVKDALRQLKQVQDLASGARTLSGRRTCTRTLCNSIKGSLVGGGGGGDFCCLFACR